MEEKVKIITEESGGTIVSLANDVECVDVYLQDGIVSRLTVKMVKL